MPGPAHGVAANSWFPPVLFVCIRFSLGAAVLLAVCAWRGGLVPAREHRPWIALSGLLLAGVSDVAVPAVGVLACVLVLDEPMTWPIALGMGVLLAGIPIVPGVGERKG